MCRKAGRSCFPGQGFTAHELYGSRWLPIPFPYLLTVAWIHEVVFCREPGLGSRVCLEERRGEALFHRGPAQHSHSLASQLWKDGDIKRASLGRRLGPGAGNIYWSCEWDNCLASLISSFFLLCLCFLFDFCSDPYYFYSIFSLLWI